MSSQVLALGLQRFRIQVSEKNDSRILQMSHQGLRYSQSAGVLVEFPAGENQIRAEDQANSDCVNRVSGTFDQVTVVLVDALQPAAPHRIGIRDEDSFLH